MVAAPYAKYPLHAVSNYTFERWFLVSTMIFEYKTMHIECNYNNKFKQKYASPKGVNE